VNRIDRHWIRQRVPLPAAARLGLWRGRPRTEEAYDG
jgi:hypothetical protein